MADMPAEALHGSPFHDEYLALAPNPPPASVEEPAAEEPRAEKPVYAYGDDAELDALWDACDAGNGDACEFLYEESPSSSEYQAFALDHLPARPSAVAYEQRLKEELEPGSIIYERA